ncbi:MAG: DUF6441 family protein [Gammaproteobacteria bacterium]|nr:DUF6441 family protein [Gammaproteobacteria bacterium]
MSALYLHFGSSRRLGQFGWGAFKPLFIGETGALRGFRRASAAARRSRRGATTVVMFILVRQVRISRRLDVTRAAELWTKRLPVLIDRHMREG